VVDYITEYNALVKNVSYSKHKDYPMVPREDIIQELWLWFLEHPNKVDEWSKMDDQKLATKFINRSLHNRAHDFCQKEKARTVGYEIADLSYYHRDVVEELLPSILTNDWSQPVFSDVNGDRKTFAPSEGGNLMTMQADVSYAFEKIAPHHQLLLQQWYTNGRNSKDLGVALGLSSENARMKVTRAIDAIIKKLGGRPPKYDSDYKTKKGRESIPTQPADETA
jgi:DNA-directed RNA polymerase specialized sigma24 family protein